MPPAPSEPTTSYGPTCVPAVSAMWQGQIIEWTQKQRAASSRRPVSSSRPSRSSRASRLQIEATGTRPHLLDLDAGEVRDGKQQVGRRLVLTGDEVPVALQAAVRAADEQRRRVAAV